MPDVLLAIPTGAVSGIVVIDMDGHIRYESLRDLEREHEPMPRTASVKTPSSGSHYWFSIAA